MPTYIYETIPANARETVRRFEIKQSMKDTPLDRDPETGRPVRRVIAGGFAPMTSAETAGSGDHGTCALPPPPRHSCGSGCGCV